MQAESESRPVVTLTCGYQPRAAFTPFHLRKQRFACIVAHRRAGTTLACVHELQHRALHGKLPRPRLAYIAPYLQQAKAIAWATCARWRRR